MTQETETQDATGPRDPWLHSQARSLLLGHLLLFSCSGFQVSPQMWLAASSFERGWSQTKRPNGRLIYPPYLLPADGILSFLKNNKPGDALCVLGLTLADLYPHDAWTFTFGRFLPGHGELRS